MARAARRVRLRLLIVEDEPKVAAALGLGLVGEGFGAAFEEELPKLFPQRGVARLAGQQPGHAASFQVLVEQSDLSRFSRPVSPLDGYETQHPTPLQGIITRERDRCPTGRGDGRQRAGLAVRAPILVAVAV